MFAIDINICYKAALLQVAGEESGENEKHWVEKVSEKKWRLFSVMIVHVGASRLFVFFFPVKVICLIILGSPWRVVRGVVRRVVRGVVRRVVRGAGSVGSPRIGGQSFLLSRSIQ